MSDLSTPDFYQNYSFLSVWALAVLSVAAGAYILRIQRANRSKTESIRLMKREFESLELHARQLDQTNKSLQLMLCLDSLTGIANRRHFDDVLDLEWRRACRTGTTLSLIMIDVDFFKAFNDAYGHQCGDDCLILLASVLRSSLNRPGDMAARYGGEEFMILLPETAAEGACDLAETMRERVESLEIAHEGSRTGKVVTISLGVITGDPASGFSCAALVAGADGALYDAKGQGRNRAVISKDPIYMPEGTSTVAGSGGLHCHLTESQVLMRPTRVARCQVNPDDELPRLIAPEERRVEPHP
jgi:diguanylate cyclase (GGDEF)-like protein